MGTETFRARALPLGLCLVGIAGAVGGCATSGSAPRTATVAPPFAWLRPAAAPRGWRSVRLSGGAALTYPHGWKVVPGDRGTATAALRDGHGGLLGYLNLTPRQGEETQANWAAFRPRHNAEEGERAVTLQASASELRFRRGRGACVRDAYTTVAGTRYIEIACLVGDGGAESVIVGAAPSRDWLAQSPAIEQAISALQT
jgi:hypothetical protein